MITPQATDGEKGQHGAFACEIFKNLETYTLTPHLNVHWLSDSGERKSFVHVSGPVQFLLKLLEFWNLDWSDAVGLLGFDDSEVGQVVQILKGTVQPRGRKFRNRIRHLFVIRKTLLALFQDLQTENEWLREQHALLDDKSPMSLLLSGSEEDLLTIKEYVYAAARL